MRQVIVTIMIVVGMIAGLGGVFAIYVLDTVLDGDDFATRTVDALSDPVVGELIAEKVIDQIVNAKPNALAARPLLEQVVARVVSGPAFRSIYEAAIRDLHRTIFFGDTDTIAVRLTDMVLLVRTQAAVLAPQLADKIPDDLTDTVIDVQSSSIAVRALRFSRNVRILAFVLPLAALLAFAASVILATDRRRALVWIGLSIIGVGVIVLILEKVLGALVISQFESEEARAVARVFWNAFISDIDVWALAVAGTGTTMVAAVFWITEPVDLAARLGQLRRFLDPPKAALPRIAWVLCWAVIGTFLIVNWQGAIRVVVTLFGVMFLVNALAELLRMIAPKLARNEERLASAEGTWVGRPKPAWLLLGGAVTAAVIVGGYFAISRSAGEGIVDVSFDPRCNGNVILCDRRFNDITIAATHNSMSAAEDGFLLANHSKGIIPQLEAGYRGLLIDILYGLDSDRTPVVVTDRAPLTLEEREQLIRELGAAAVRSAEELRQRNLDAGGTREIYLCHGLCELGAIRFSTEMERIRGWLENNPREVLIIIIQDEVAPGDVAEVFQEADLLKYLHTQALDEPWPTLRHMIDSGSRLVVMAENDTGGISWYHDVFVFAQDTPYSFKTVEDFNCDSNRGLLESPLFMINHWVTPALAEAGSQANSAESLLERIEVCQETRGMSPNILAVDFYNRGDTLEIVKDLNERRAFR